LEKLRREIALTLGRAAWSATQPSPPAGTIYTQEQFAMWLAAADECIRQMEWARRTVTGSEQDYFVFGGLRYPFPPIVAAPEGWKP
jgi:hypothetical protein